MSVYSPNGNIYLTAWEGNPPAQFHWSARVTMVTCMGDPGHILRKRMIVKRNRKVGKPNKGG